jgi:hypothetical protein
MILSLFLLPHILQQLKNTSTNRRFEDTHKGHPYRLIVLWVP